jgi:hypothetical protein
VIDYHSKLLLYPMIVQKPMLTLCCLALFPPWLDCCEDGKVRLKEQFKHLEQCSEHRCCAAMTFATTRLLGAPSRQIRDSDSTLKVLDGCRHSWSGTCSFSVTISCLFRVPEAIKAVMLSMVLSGRAVLDHSNRDPDTQRGRSTQSQNLSSPSKLPVIFQ